MSLHLLDFYLKFGALSLGNISNETRNLRLNIWPPAAACRNFQSLWQSHNFQWLLWVQRPPRWTWRREIFPCFCRICFSNFWWAGANKKSDDLVQQSEVYCTYGIQGGKGDEQWLTIRRICQPSQPVVMENRRLHYKTHCPSFVCFLLDAYFYFPGKRLVTSQSWHFKWNPFPPLGRHQPIPYPIHGPAFSVCSMVAPEMEHFDSRIPSHDHWFIVHILF